MANTLTSPPLVALLDRLFTHADASWSRADPALANMSDAEQARQLRVEKGKRNSRRANEQIVDAGRW